MGSAKRPDKSRHPQYMCIDLTTDRLSESGSYHPLQSLGTEPSPKQGVCVWGVGFETSWNSSYQTALSPVVFRAIL